MLCSRLLEIAPYTNGIIIIKIAYATSVQPVERCPNCWYLNSFIVFGLLAVRFYVFFMFYVSYISKVLRLNVILFPYFEMSATL